MQLAPCVPCVYGNVNIASKVNCFYVYNSSRNISIVIVEKPINRDLLIRSFPFALQTSLDKRLKLNEMSIERNTLRKN